MGWTGIQTQDSIQEVFEQEFNKSNYSVTKVVFKAGRGYSNVAYAAIKHPNGYTFGCVVLFDVSGHGFSREILYKEIDESMGPAEDNCPKSILDLLSPIEELGYPGYSKEWRGRCYDNLGLKLPSTNKQLSIF